MDAQKNPNSGEQKSIPSLLNRNLSDKHILRIDEVENAIDSLETAIQFLQREDSLKWKWIAIALHHSLYSFCIAALVCRDYTNVLEKGKNEDDGRFYKIGDDLKWRKSKIVKRNGGPRYKIQWEYTDEEPPPEKNPEQMGIGSLLKDRKYKLIGFWTALARVQDPVWHMSNYPPISQALTLSDSQWESITRLHENVRNGLIHFVPMSLVMSVSEIQNSCKDVLDAIEFLASKSSQILYRDEMSQKERIAKAIKGLREGL
jgi:hypothetical protein